MQGRQTPGLLLSAPPIDHVGGWEPYHLHNLAHISWVWICTAQIPHNMRYRQIHNLEYLDRDLSDVRTFPRQRHAAYIARVPPRERQMGVGGCTQLWPWSCDHRPSHPY